MHSPKTAADQLQVSRQTVHRWSTRFAGHLSADANPEPGTERRFDDQDLAVLRTVARMRADRATWDEIAAALDAGHIDQVSQDPGDDPDPDPEPAALVPVDVARAWLEPLRETVTALQEHNRMLLQENADLRERLERPRGWFARLLGL